MGIIINIIINSLNMFHSRQNINDHKNHKIYGMLRK